MPPVSPARPLASGMVAILATGALLLGASPALAETAEPGPLAYSHDAPAAPSTSDSTAVAEAEVQRAAETYLNALVGGEELAGGESIVSANGAYEFVMQTDGNAVVYRIGAGATWSSGTAGSGDHLAMQTDGNVVIYSAQDRPVWFTGTSGQPGATLTIQDDGNLVVYREDGSPAWASSVGGPIAAPVSDYLGGGGGLAAGTQLTSTDGRYEAAMQTDGNFVVYGPYGPEWSSGTSGAGSRLAMQNDGNVVIYGANGSVKWTTGTGGNPGAVLVMQNDGNLVLYGLNGVLWTSRAQVTTDALSGSGTLLADEKLVSSNGAWRAVMQPDGNFVVYGPNGPSWSTGTRSAPDALSASQFDLSPSGYLSVSGWGPSAHWGSFPRYFVNEGPAVEPFTLVMQNDGNLVEYDGRNRPVWASRGL